METQQSNTYDPPRIEVVTFPVEHGFAASQHTGGNISDYGDGGSIPW